MLSGTFQSFVHDDYLTYATNAVKKERKMSFFPSQAWDKEKIMSPHDELNFYQAKT